ncbi:MAG: HD domain-containing protein [Candidatus Limnocylindrus sp.]
MNIATRAHRLVQVRSHLLAVVRQQVARLGLTDAVGAEGDAHLRSLGATLRARRAFAAAHPADQASATRTAASLRRLGAKRDDQLAALLHDLGKGQVGLIPRVIHVLEGSPVHGQARGPLARSRQILRRHASVAPALAAKLGASRGTIAILRELARQESRRTSREKATPIDARVRLLIDIDSGVAR